MDRVHHPPARVFRRVMVVTVLTVHLGACSAPGDTPPPQGPTIQETSAMPSPVPSSSTPEIGATTLLTVEIRQSESAEPARYVLECSGGTPGPNTTLPNPTRACATVESLGASFFTALPDKNIACTQQYGGPQTAVISGTVNGTQVLAGFSLTDGCEISRWNAVRSILGTGGAT